MRSVNRCWPTSSPSSRRRPRWCWSPTAPNIAGALIRVSGAQTIALAPLSDTETGALVTDLLGPDPSVGRLATLIVEKAAGNPFFAEEIVRELAEQGVLRGTAALCFDS